MLQSVDLYDQTKQPAKVLWATIQGKDVTAAQGLAAALAALESKLKGKTSIDCGRGCTCKNEIDTTSSPTQVSVSAEFSTPGSPNWPDAQANGTVNVTWRVQAGHCWVTPPRTTARRPQAGSKRPLRKATTRSIR